MVDFTDCWTYLGDVFRQTALGVRWLLGFQHPKHLNYCLYYLTGGDKAGSKFILLLYVSNFIRGQLDQAFFQRLIENTLHPISVNSDYLPMEE